MKHRIHHSTHYMFDTPVSYALQKVRLRPLSNPLQHVIDWDISVQGGKIETQYQDHYGNHVDLVSAQEGATELIVTATGQVETKDTQGVLGAVYGRAPLWHFQQSTPLTEAGAGLIGMAQCIGEHGTVLNGLHALSARVLETVPYETGATNANTTAREAVKIGKGVCQDHSHIFMAAARNAGIPARYVSGYLRMADQTDQEASHAWAEAHIPDLGWVGFDVSNGISPDDGYVRLAIGRDASDCAPISGLRIGAGAERMVVTLQVQQ